MIKRYELSDPNSCLNKAGDHEPVFVIRAKDRLASMVVRHWAAMAELFGDHELEKIVEARHLADLMILWRSGNID